jgi:hypothetical protein
MSSRADFESRTDKLRLQIESLEFLIELLQQQIASYDNLGNAPAQLRSDLIFAERTAGELREKLYTQND